MKETPSPAESARRIVDGEPTEKQVGFEVAGKKLEGMIVKAGYDGPFDILLLGGGGNLPYKDYYGLWQKQLANIGVSSMSFDFRGVGASEGEFDETGLATRLEDARAAAEYLKSQQKTGRKLYVMGVSMGGTIAIQLANELHADGLVLVAPAAYSEEARQKSFGPDFTAALRKTGSWENSPDFAELERFEGKVLLAYGDQDNVIPPPILERYDDVARQKGAVLKIPNVGHRFIRQDDPISAAGRQEVQVGLEIISLQ